VANRAPPLDVDIAPTVPLLRIDKANRVNLGNRIGDVIPPPSLMTETPTLRTQAAVSTEVPT